METIAPLVSLVAFLLGLAFGWTARLYLKTRQLARRLHDLLKDGARVDCLLNTEDASRSWLGKYADFQNGAKTPEVRKLPHASNEEEAEHLLKRAENLLLTALRDHQKRLGIKP